MTKSKAKTSKKYIVVRGINLASKSDAMGKRIEVSDEPRTLATIGVPQSAAKGLIDKRALVEFVDVEEDVDGEEVD